MKNFILTLLVISSTAFASSEKSPIAWQDWTNDLFVKAQKENKFVLLDLEAVWCHWCHVMEKETYSNPKVIALIQKHFIAVKVDQDARPDISRRYEDWGWPATIFFAPTGKEVSKQSGFLNPEEMIGILEGVVNGKIKEEEEKAAVPSENGALNPDLKKRITDFHKEKYDPNLGGWGSIHKFLFGDTEEYALRRAWKKDKEEAKRVKKTLTAALALIDPAWGGVYQYSVKTWKEIHFEKIAESQAKNLHLYSNGYLLFGDKSYLKAANDVAKFLTTFLLDAEGAFYTSMDADLVKGVHSESYFKLSDKARRAKGIPAIDKHIYARENGWFISGLTSLYSASKDAKTLEAAIRAAKWIEVNRKLGNGGFSHDAKDVAGPYLGDSLEMGIAFQNLYQVTGDKSWLTKSVSAAKFIEQNFVIPAGGYKTSATPLAAGLSPEPVPDENIRLARFTNLLSYYSGEESLKKMAKHAMKYLVSPDVANIGVVLADEELAEGPVHMTIVGGKNDPAAKGLFLEAIAYPSTYKRVDWWDKSEGNLPNADVQYPALAKAALFACVDRRCSFPLFDPKDVRERVTGLYEKKF